MSRRVLAGTVGFVALLCGLLAPAAGAAGPLRLYLSEGAAFAILGHWCGGIQQQVYVTGFATDGYPTGNATLKTTCGGSGRGGGGHSTTYTGSTSVVWTWFGETRSYSSPATGEDNPTFSEVDAHGDHVYNQSGAAYLETGEPPLQPPGPPTGVSATVGLYESGESEFLRLEAGWTVAPETSGLLEYSTITATPVDNPKAPVLSAQVIPYFSSGHVEPVEPNTTYSVSVTSTDREGTSEPSVPVEIRTPNSDGEGEREHPTVETCGVDQGTISLTPGLKNRAAVQKVTVNGELGACEGPYDFESATYTEQLTTTEKVGCGVLSSSVLEANTRPQSMTVRWAPSEEGSSTGMIVFPLAEAPLTGISGQLEGGPFSSPVSITAGAIDMFTGAETCGQKVSRKKSPPVKSGVFFAGPTEIS